MIHNKIRISIIIGTFLWALIIGCGDEIEAPVNSPSQKEDSVLPQDTTPPSTPLGLKSKVGDSQVTLTWYANKERDIAGYKVMRKKRENDKFAEISRISQNNKMGNGMIEYVDSSVHNGTTYWYAIVSYDNSSNESPVSTAVSATPRPQGLVTLSIDDGFDFKQHKKVPGDSAADIVFDISDITYNGSAWVVKNRISLILIIPNDNLRIQDMGYTDNFSVIDFAPFFPKGNDDDINDPMSSYTKHVIEIQTGHTYVIWFDERGENRDLYGKFRIREINLANTPSVTIEWALQEKANTPQLAPQIQIPPD